MKTGFVRANDDGFFKYMWNSSYIDFEKYIFVFLNWKKNMLATKNFDIFQTTCNFFKKV